MGKNKKRNDKSVIADELHTLQNKQIPLAKPTCDQLLVGLDRNEKDIPILVVARKSPRGLLTALNVIAGDEAIELYDKLTTYKPIINSGEAYLEGRKNK